VEDDTTTYRDAVASVNNGVPVTLAAAAIVAKMSIEEKLWCLDGDFPFWAGLGDLANGGYHKRPFPAARIERLGIPGFAFSDGPRGVVIGPATCFPVSMARGATFDLDLEERIGEAIGKELRAIGADLFGGVCVNVLRHPAWGRAQETYGEDPFHVGEFGAALVRGVQRHAMACVKHFAANSMENSRFEVDVTVDEVALHEVFLPQFRRIVQEGVAVVMSAYNSLNGEWCGQNATLLTEVLRDEWGFGGFVISDWIFGLRNAGRSVVAGLDVEMPYRMVRATGLRTALDEGTVTTHDVDRCVISIMATLLRFNHLLESPRPDISVLACAEHRALAREAAAKAVVLLQNAPVDGAALLPLATASINRAAIVGTLADLRNLGDGGSSDVWAPDVVTPLTAIRAALPQVDVVYDDGSDLASATALAATCDVAIVVVGYTRDDEGEYIGDEATPAELRDLFPGPDDPALVEAFAAEVARHPGLEASAGIATAGALSFATGGDRTSLRLRDHDEELIAAVADANQRTVVALVAGSAVIMADWSERVPAIVQSWYAGMEGGHGLADVLCGHYNPSGRLPFSVPRNEVGLPHFERHTKAITYDRWHGWWKFDRDAITPHFPFGFGLSYTQFSWGPFSAATVAGTIELRATLTNIGVRDGTEIVQAYAEVAPDADTPRPRRLVGFARVEIPATESVDVVLAIGVDRLAVRDRINHTSQKASGTYEIQIARFVGDPDTQTVSVEL